MALAGCLAAWQALRVPVGCCQAWTARSKPRQTAPKQILVQY